MVAARIKTRASQPARVTTLRNGLGFTLTELAVVLLIVALLIGGLLVPLTAQTDLRNYSDAQKSLAEIQEAIYGYAASHKAGDGRPYLPCPDQTIVLGATIPNDGLEDRTVSGCVVNEGNVPWATLGLAPADPWLNRFRYRVHVDFSNSTNGFSLDTAANLNVCAQKACTTITAKNLPAVILSHGRNGAGAINSGTGAPNPSPTGDDELENANGDGDNTYVSRIQSDSSAAGGEFDDVVAWIPTSLLFSRMIAAGRLP